MEIYYSHKDRKITTDSGDEISYGCAMHHVTAGKVDDCDQAFMRLMQHGGDMEAVEADYQAMERQRQ